MPSLSPTESRDPGFCLIRSPVMERESPSALIRLAHVRWFVEGEASGGRPTHWSSSRGRARSRSSWPTAPTRSLAGLLQTRRSARSRNPRFAGRAPERFGWPPYCERRSLPRASGGRTVPAALNSLRADPDGRCSASSRESSSGRLASTSCRSSSLAAADRTASDATVFTAVCLLADRAASTSRLRRGPTTAKSRTPPAAGFVAERRPRCRRSRTAPLLASDAGGLTRSRAARRCGATCCTGLRSPGRCPRGSPARAASG